MRYFAHPLHAIVLVAVLVGVLAATHTTTPHIATADENTPAPEDSEKNVAPPAGWPGTNFSFYATGFDGREKAGYWFNAPDGTIYANRFKYVIHTYQGRADWSWTVPEDAPPGTWSAVVHGVESNTEQVVLFEVLSPGDAEEIAETPHGGAPIAPPGSAPPNPEGVAVQPASGIAGTKFEFFATGFERKEKVSFWASDPAARHYGSTDYETRANINGRADWSWRAPGDALPGVWIMVARGLDSGREQIIYFDIYDATANTPAPGEGPARSAELNAPDVTVDPPVGTPGTRFHFRAAGFEPRQKLYFWATDPSGENHEKEKYNIRSNEEGVAYWNWRTPDNAATGVWQMFIFSDETSMQKVIFFDVRAPSNEAATPPTPTPTVAAPNLLPNPPGVAVEPAAGPPGTRFAFFATGYKAGEDVNYWAVAPDGTEYRKHQYHVNVNNNGRADWTWKAPDDAPAGIWTMNGKGKDSEVERAIFFAVQ
jgi:hypothetical protein